jgi:hypothetical protein
MQLYAAVCSTAATVAEVGAGRCWEGSCCCMAASTEEFARQPVLLPMLGHQAACNAAASAGSPEAGGAGGGSRPAVQRCCRAAGLSASGGHQLDIDVAGWSVHCLDGRCTFCC